MTDTSQGNAKVLFRVPDDEGTAEVETLWATCLGEDKYKLENSPFYAYGVSWQDVVIAPYSEEEQFPTFQDVVEKSGNRTVRVIFDPPIEEGNKSDKILKGLVELGCDYEGANSKYIAINIPPNVSLDSVRNYLIECQATWEHADPAHDNQKRMKYRNQEIDQKPRNRRLRVWEWILLVLFTIPGIVLLLGAIPEFLSMTFGSIAIRLIFAATVVACFSLYIILFWLSYRSVLILLSKEYSASLKKQLFISLIRAYWVIPALLIVLVALTSFFVSPGVSRSELLISAFLLIPAVIIVFGVVAGMLRYRYIS